MALPERYQFAQGKIELNANREKRTLTVKNTGDRAIQVGSHFHFFEANSALEFDRKKALGMHLDIAAGTSVRFEPGDTHEVRLCHYGGLNYLVGFNGLLHGGIRGEARRQRAVRRLDKLGFKDTGNRSSKKEK